MTKVKKHRAEGSGLAIDSTIEQNINISKYKTLSSNRYIKLPKD